MLTVKLLARLGPLSASGTVGTPPKRQAGGCRPISPNGPRELPRGGLRSRVTKG